MGAKIFAVVNRKGGVAKTTTAVTLAHGLALKIMQDGGEGSVLLIDLDPQGNVAFSLGVEPGEICISQLLTGDAELQEVVISANRVEEGGPERPNLYLIPASDRLAEVKVELVANAAVAGVMQQMTRKKNKQVGLDEILQERLKHAVEVFDYIILDCPPTLDLLQEAVYRFAQAAIVPVKVDYLGAAGAAKHTQGILDAQAEGIDIRVAVVVPTFVKARQVLARQMLETLIKTYGARRVSEPIPTSVDIEEAPASGGLTIFEYAPQSKPAEAYWNLVEKIYHDQI
jgi:chromosome partitioning protein